MTKLSTIFFAFGLLLAGCQQHRIMIRDADGICTVATQEPHSPLRRGDRHSPKKRVGICTSRRTTDPGQDTEQGWCDDEHWRKFGHSIPL